MVKLVEAVGCACQVDADALVHAQEVRCGQRTGGRVGEQRVCLAVVDRGRDLGLE